MKAKTKTLQAYQTLPEIQVDLKGKWYYRKELIKNESLLLYFKKQIRRDSLGYYIENIFGDRREHAYLNIVNEATLFVTAIEPIPDPKNAKKILIKIRLDSNENICLSAQDLHLFTSNNIGVVIKERGDVLARLSSSAMASLTTYLSQDEKDIYSLVLPRSKQKEKLSKAKLDDYLQKEIPKINRHCK